MKLSLKTLQEEIQKLSDRLKALEASSPSPSLSAPVCAICGKPGSLELVTYSLNGPSGARVSKPIHPECKP